MPLPNVYWTTLTPATQDTAGVQMPDLTDDSFPGAEDGHRVLVSHVMALRNKLQNAYLEIGTTPGNLPTTSLRYRAASLESRMTTVETNLAVLYPTHAGRHAFGGADAITIAESQVTNLISDLAAKANDTAVVHNTGNETVGGVKAFTSSPTGPDPTTSTQLSTKNYVDLQVATLSGQYGAGVQTVTALRAVGASSRVDHQIRLVDDKAALYRFASDGLGADDGDFIIVPNDITPPAPGRWFKVQSATQNHEQLLGLLGGGPSDHQHLTTTEAGNVPSTGQKQSLAGSYGTPGTGNEYVTKTDPQHLRGPLTTKGDIYVRDGSGAQRQPIGVDGQILVADASQGTGMRWAAGGAIIPAATPAVVLRALELVPASNIDLTSSSFVDVSNGTDKAEATITFPYQGQYVFQVDLSALLVSGAETIAAFQLVIDSGDPGSVTLAPANPLAWSVACGEVGEKTHKTFTVGPVALAAGPHKITLQWKQQAGTDTVRISTSEYVNIVALNLGGSGAGGTVASLATLSSDFSVASDTFADVTGLSVTVTATDDEYLIASFEGPGDRNTADGSLYVQMVLDGNAVDAPLSANDSAPNGKPLNLSFSRIIGPLAGGQHTIKLQAKYDIAGGKILAPAKLQVLQFRGGLIPIQQAGAVVAQIPKALNFASGATVSTGPDGTVNVNVVGAGAIGATEDPTPFTDMGTGATTTAASQTVGVKWTPIRACQVIGIKFYTAKTGAHTIRCKLWTGGSAVTTVDVACSGPGSYRGIFTTPYVISTIGAVYYATMWETGGVDYSKYTAVLAEDQYNMGKAYLALNRASSYASGDANPSSTDASDSFPGDPIIQNNADVAVGAAAAENLPIFQYNSTTVADLVAAPGASPTLRMTLNDGKQYTSAVDLSVNFATTGLGGLDTGTHSTGWYYLYGVPGAAAGSLSAVASVQVPSVGPTGYPIFGYLCAVLSGTGPALVEATQEGADFLFAGQREAAAVVAYGTTLQTTKDEPSISDVCPATASSVMLSQLLQVDGSGTGFVKQELYVEGKSSVINDLIEGGVAAATYAKARARVPTPNIPKKLGYLSDVVSGTQALTAQKLLFHGWTDGYRVNQHPRGQGASAVRQMVLVAPPASTISSLYAVTGSLSFDPTSYNGLAMIKFLVTGYVSSVALTGSVRLYNVTDGSIVSTLTFTSTTPAAQLSSVLTLPNTAKVYEVRIKVDGVSGLTDVFNVTWAGLQIDPM